MICQCGVVNNNNRMDCMSCGEIIKAKHKGKVMEKVAHYAWPSGYPLFYYVESADGKFHSCPSCVNQNRIGKNVDCCKAYINYEDDTLFCEVCEKQIESAYGD